jgi:hypothetical protein
MYFRAKPVTMETARLLRKRMTSSGHSIPLNFILQIFIVMQPD